MICFETFHEMQWKKNLCRQFLYSHNSSSTMHIQRFIGIVCYVTLRSFQRLTKQKRTFYFVKKSAYNVYQGKVLLFNFETLIIRLPLEKNVFPYHFAKILAKIQEIKLEGTSAERKWNANRRLHKTLPKWRKLVLIHLVVLTNDHFKDCFE